jgi:hypothetical protein
MFKRMFSALILVSALAGGVVVLSGVIAQSAVACPQMPGHGG